MRKNIIMIVALALAAFGLTMGGAVAGNLITSADIENGTIKAVDIKPEVVEKFSKPGKTGKRGPAGVDGADGADGETGPAGPKGDTGATGSTGPRGYDGAPGLSNVRADEPYVHTIAANSVGVAFTACPAGKAALGGGFRLNGFAAEAFQGGGSPVDVTALASEAVGVVDGVIVNTYQHPAFPQDETGRFLPNAWAVTVHNDTDQPRDVRVNVVCANVAG